MPEEPIRRPDPDPSSLTTAQLLREISMTRELMAAEFAVIRARLDGMDKAILLLQAFADRTPTTMDIQHEVSALREVSDERFKGVGIRFDESKEGITLAFASAKEAASKSDANTETQLRSIDNRISDIKDRVIAMESVKKGMDATWALIISLIFIGLGLAGWLGSLFAKGN